MPYYFDVVLRRFVIACRILIFTLVAGAVAGCPGGSTRTPDDNQTPVPDKFPSIQRFEASPSSLLATAQPVQLIYEVSDADTVEITPDVLTPPVTELSGAPQVLVEKTTTFTLTARSSAGETTQVLTVTVEDTSVVRIVSFTATPTVTTANSPVTLAWDTLRATSVSVGIQGGDVLEPDAGAQGSLTVTPADTTIYVLTADGPGGPVESRIFLEVGKAPAVEDFTASPERITAGAASTLSWTVDSADEIRIEDAQGNVVHRPTEDVGTFDVRPQSTTEYSVVGTNAFGEARARATVTVENGGPVTITDFSATPSSLLQPGDVMLSWAVQGADSVALTANSQPVAGFPGSASGTLTLPVQISTVFELTAMGNNMTDTRQLTVNVAMRTDQDPPTLMHTPVIATQIAGADVMLEAMATDADSGLAGVDVHYRVTGEAMFTKLALTDAGNGRFTGTIPGAAVMMPSVEYYIEAADMAPTPNLARSPEMAPTTFHTFSVQDADTMPPVITHTQIADGQLAAADVPVSVEIMDMGSGVNAAQLFYRTEGQANYQSVALVAMGATTYVANIPGATVQTPAVEYYVAATDGATPANTAQLPAGAPANVFRFTVTPLDTAGPVITHTPITNGQTAGGSVNVTAEVTDASGVAGVSLFYRTQGSPTFVVLAMTETMGQYRAAIPGNIVDAPGVEYYIEATDTVAPPNTGRSPATAPAMPYVFSVEVVDTNPPTIVHNPVTGAQEQGMAVTISAEITDASGVTSAVLNYRAVGATGFTAVPMTGGPMYTAQIPAVAVTTVGVQYYLQAADGAMPQNAGTLPLGAPTQRYEFPVGTVETETNDTAATADPLLANGMLENVGLGALTPSGDQDFWFVDVPMGGFYNLQIESTSGGAALCPAPTDTIVRLYAGDGTTQIATDSVDGVGNCGSLDPMRDNGTVALAPGRYFVRIEESGNNAVVGAYELRARLVQTQCGNGILEIPASEQCDDGNTAAGDGCSATCTHEPEGTAMAPGATFMGGITPAGDTDLYALVVGAGQNIIAETTDGATGCNGDSVLDLIAPDGVTVLGSDDDDGISTCSQINAIRDTWAAGLAAGTYYLRVRGFRTTTVINAYTLTIQIRDGICGNGNVETGEMCDDGNTRSFDGCSNQCQWELEGTATGMGASFTGSIMPTGNVDFYQIDIQQGESIRVETFSPAEGDCATGDTIIRLLQSDRATEVATDDQDGIRNCSLLDPGRDLAVRNLAGGTYFLSVAEFGNNATIPTYVVNIQILRPGCGNGWLDGNDQCDDGNTMPGDGCNATCQFEGTGEMEPNNDTTMANALITGTATTGQILGALADAADVDVYSVVMPGGRHLFAEVSDGNGGCNNGADVRVRNAMGTILVSDTNDGPGGTCGRVSPASDAAVRNLAAGTYFVEVYGGTNSAAYTLDVRVLTPGCGDALLDMGESCDDGNQVSGDGCSAMCQLEGGLPEVEPNDTNAQSQRIITDANMTPRVRVVGVVSDANDDDQFLITVPAGYHLFAEITDGNGGCTNNGNLRLLSSTGNQIASDSRDGPFECGRISAGFNTGAMSMAAGDYILEVKAAAGQTDIYALDVAVLPPNVCGNMILDANEQCDDGNTAGGDGCSAACMFDLSESEANDDFGTADALMSLPLQTISGQINTAGDDDWYAVAVTAGQSLTVQTHNGALDQCETNNDTVVELFRPDGVTTLTSDDDDGPGTCSHIYGPQAGGLAAGTYFVRVRPFSSTRTFPYGLTIQIR